MVNTIGTFDFPPWYINKYLLSILNQYDINLATGTVDGKVIEPFVAAGVISDLDEYYRSLALVSSGSGGGPVLPTTIFYDRMIRLRTSPFYVGKREQTLYTVFGKIDDAHKIGMIISRVLDREDASAQDLNKWINDNRSQLNSDGFPANVFFRSMRVFQVDESRDLIELNTYRDNATMHKYIVEYDYHFKDNPDFL